MHPKVSSDRSLQSSTPSQTRSSPMHLRPLRQGNSDTPHLEASDEKQMHSTNRVNKTERGSNKIWHRIICSNLDRRKETVLIMYRAGQTNLKHKLMLFLDVACITVSLGNDVKEPFRAQGGCMHRSGARPLSSSHAKQSLSSLLELYFVPRQSRMGGRFKLNQQSSPTPARASQ